MTDSTSSRSSRSEDNNIKKKVSYSTDYMPNLLQDSQKMLPLDQRILFKKQEYDNNSSSYRKDNDRKEKDKDRDDYSHNSEKLSDYMTNDGENIANSASNKYSNTQLYGNTNSFFSNANPNTQNYKLNEEEKKPEVNNENKEGKENIFNDN